VSSTVGSFLPWAMLRGAPTPPGRFSTAYILTENDLAYRSFWLIYGKFSVFDRLVYPCIARNFAHVLRFSVGCRILPEETRASSPRTSAVRESADLVFRLTELQRTL